MKTQARQRSASALRSMFLKMRKESLLQQPQPQQATAATTTTTGDSSSAPLRGASPHPIPIKVTLPLYFLSF